MRLKQLLMACFFLTTTSAVAQRVALKTNALYWMTVTPNLSLEARVAPHVTLDLAVEGNLGVKVGKIKPKFAAFRPMVRYYFQRPMARHYVAAGLIVMDYKAELNNREYDGIGYGVGFSYGYVFTIGRRWNLEPSVGVALSHYREDRYRLDGQYAFEKHVSGWRPVPMNVGLSVSYVFK